MWRASLYGVAAGAVLGLVAGIYAQASGHPEQGAIYGAIAGYLGTIPASMLAVKQALSKHLASLTSLATSSNA
jgi:uncharacterized membrane protein YeaQ/YmgE (transglycosylase-associated protein family)